MSAAARARAIAARQRLARRVVIGAALTGIALVAVFPKGSAPSEFGAVLLLMALPMSAWVLILFAKKRAPMVATPPSFAAEAPFVPQVQARVAPAGNSAQDPSAAHASIALPAERYYLLLGTEGFSARFRARAAEPDHFDVQFLKPDEALPRFVDGTAFRVFDGVKVVAQGTVTERATPD